MRRLIVGFALLVAPLAFAHYYIIRPYTDPAPVVGAPALGSPTSTAPVLGAPTTSVQWACVTSTGTVTGALQATQASAETACGAAVAADGVTRFLEERSTVTRTSTVTTTTPTTTTTRTKRFELRGGTTIRVSDANAQFIVVSGGGGSAGEEDGGELDPLTSINTLEMVYPLPVGVSGTGLDAQHQLFVAYPGIEKVEPIIAYGGMPPYNCSGSNLPSGAVVEDYTAESGQTLCRFRWPNPQTDAADVEVCISDVHAAEDCSTFSIDVTTTPFRFTDCDDGNDAWDGTAPAFVSGTTGPWASLQAVEEDSRINQIMYFRGGSCTYTHDGIILAFSADSGLTGGGTGTLSGTHSSTTADLGTNAPIVDVAGRVIYFTDHREPREITSYNTGTGVATFSPALSQTLVNGNTWRVGTLASGSVPQNPVVNIDGEGNGGLGTAVQWLGYPGESPTIDLRQDTRGAAAPYIKMGESESVVVKNITITDAFSKSFEVAEDDDFGALMCFNTFTDGGEGATDGLNSAFIMFTSYGGSEPGTSYAPVVCDNAFGTAGVPALKLYSSRKAVIVGNHFELNAGVAAKASSPDFDIKLNWFDEVDEAIGGNFNSIGGTQSGGEFRFNCVMAGASGDAAHYVAGYTNPVEAVQSYRNTYLGRINVEDLRSTDGVRSFERDVILNSDSAESPWPYFFDVADIIDSGQLTRTDNLTGADDDTIVDQATCLLKGASRSSYGPGTSTRRGHEIG
jgi:hypothetical protein